MRVYVKGTPIDIPSGPPGADGSPIGTIISFMGTKPPNGYLICDGSTVSISDYQDLATFFEDQFGSTNYFGGDGISTFGLPDLRNEFLRGYHNNGTEKLSGDIGEHQNATTFPNFGAGYKSGSTTIGLMYGYTSPITPDGATYPGGMDTSIPAVKSFRVDDTSGMWDASYAASTFTARPTNVAVLYCIKAINGSGGGSAFVEEYDQDGWYVRKWSNGYAEFTRDEIKTIRLNDWTEYGNIYANTPSVNFQPKVYPISLLQETETASLTTDSGGVFLNFASKTKNRSRTYAVLRGTLPSGDLIVTLSIFVSGYWKDPSGASAASTPTIIPEFNFSEWFDATGVASTANSMTSGVASTANSMTSGITCDDEA